MAHPRPTYNMQVHGEKQGIDIQSGSEQFYDFCRKIFDHQDSPLELSIAVNLDVIVQFLAEMPDFHICSNTGGGCALCEVQSRHTTAMCWGVGISKEAGKILKARVV